MQTYRDVKQLNARVFVLQNETQTCTYCDIVRCDPSATVCDCDAVSVYAVDDERRLT